MNFWDTVAGHRFAEGTVPELTKAINRLADAVEESNRLTVKQLSLMEKSAENEKSAEEKLFL